MPFVVVNNQHPTAVTGTELPIVRLAWTGGEDGIAQLGMQLDRETILETARLMQEFPDDEHHTFYTAGLDRSDLNELVRGARRARNAVFGADE